jgi:hypothetical protein
MAIKKEHLIEKRNTLNEIMWRDRMTLQALRFLSVYLSRIDARNLETRKVRFTIKEFSALMEFKGVWSKPYYKATIDRLMGKIIHQDTKSGGMHSFPLFQRAKLEKDSNGNWYVEMNASDDALPLMFDLKDRYFTYELWNVLHLKSFNALRMYEILKQYEKAGERTLSLAHLRELLAIEADEYPRWSDFKRRILDSNQKALAENTDIRYTYEPIRNGRGGKVTGINFTIKKNNGVAVQLTFEEFIGLQSNNQLAFSDVGGSPTDEIVVDVAPKNKQARKKKESVEKVFSLEEQKILEEYAELCKNQFTDSQIQEIYEILSNRITEQHRVECGYRRAYLQDAFCILLVNERKEEIKHRFSYMKSTLKNILRERALEK